MNINKKLNQKKTISCLNKINKQIQKLKRNKKL